MITGIIVWLIVGAISGWLASLVLRTGTQQGIVLNIVVGIIGGVVAGLLFGRANMGRGFPFESFLWAVLGALVLLAIFNLLFRKKLG